MQLRARSRFSAAGVSYGAFEFAAPSGGVAGVGELAWANIMVAAPANTGEAMPYETISVANATIAQELRSIVFPARSEQFGRWSGPGAMCPNLARGQSVYPLRRLLHSE
jgi:hypothetical protein